MDTSGLRLDQAPPLWIPLAFFSVAPAAMVAAGAVLAFAGPTALASPFAPATVALTHVLTLGVLTAVMFGALYQMTPVVAGAAVPVVRVAAAVLAALVVGCVGLVGGVAGWGPAWTAAGMLALGTAVTLFALPVGVALFRASAGGPTVWGMRLALVGLVALASFGVWMARGYAGAPVSVARVPWMQLHIAFALLGWVGSLIVGVSWQVVPMFYLAAPPRPATQWAVFALAVAGLVAPAFLHAVMLLSGVPWGPWLTGRAIPLAAAPAALAIGVVHPWIVLRSLAGRRRKRVDASLWFWNASMACAPLAVLAAAASVAGAPRASVAFAWLALWGWGSMLVHGMLTRIVPFLVWFHRFSPLIGLRPVPSMRSMLPDRRVRIAFALHASALVAGLAAVGLPSVAIGGIAGTLTAATGVALAFNIVGVLRHRAGTAAAWEPAS